MNIHYIATMCFFLGVFFSCSSCVQNRECYWCPLKVECYKNGEGCDGQITPKVSKYI